MSSPQPERKRSGCLLKARSACASSLGVPVSVAARLKARASTRKAICEGQRSVRASCLNSERLASAPSKQPLRPPVLLIQSQIPSQWSNLARAGQYGAPMQQRRRRPAVEAAPAHRLRQLRQDGPGARLGDGGSSRPDSRCVRSSSSSITSWSRSKLGCGVWCRLQQSTPALPLVQTGQARGLG